MLTRNHLALIKNDLALTENRPGIIRNYLAHSQACCFCSADISWHFELPAEFGLMRSWEDVKQCRTFLRRTTQTAAPGSRLTASSAVRGRTLAALGLAVGGRRCRLSPHTKVKTLKRLSVTSDFSWLLPLPDTTCQNLATVCFHSAPSLLHTCLHRSLCYWGPD